MLYLYETCIQANPQERTSLWTHDYHNSSVAALSYQTLGSKVVESWVLRLSVALQSSSHTIVLMIVGSIPTKVLRFFLSKTSNI